MFESSKKIGVRPLIKKKLEWLKDLIDKLIKMSGYHNNPAATSVHMNFYAVDEMLHNIKLGKLPRNKDMLKCNDMLKQLKILYKFNVDWRGDIINCNNYTSYVLNR